MFAVIACINSEIRFVRVISQSFLVDLYFKKNIIMDIIKKLNRETRDNIIYKRFNFILNVLIICELIAAIILTINFIY